MRTKKIRTPPPVNHIRMYREDYVREQDRRCYYCYSDITMDNATFDHINPKSKGGRDRKENGCAACKPCNSLKDAMSINQFEKLIKSPKPEDSLEVWMAHIRRRIGLGSLRSSRKIKRAMGIQDRILQGRSFY